VTGFTETFLMATGFLLVCLVAGFLVPKEQKSAEMGANSTSEGAAIGASAPEGARG
jgi:preprotein translocase subunit SecG